MISFARFFVAAVILISVGGGSGAAQTRAEPADHSAPGLALSDRRPRRVFIVVLENEGFATTFGKDSDAPYLANELTSKGELLTQYFGIGHFSLDNYIAMVSGQAPTLETEADCLTYQDFVPTTAALDNDGQIRGSGCVYSLNVLTIANQLETKRFSWRGYMEDMSGACEHPVVGQPDGHVHAQPGDQYATRHNPFVYFHSIIDSPTCQKNVVPLTALDADLKTVETTPNLVFITPISATTDMMGTQSFASAAI